MKVHLCWRLIPWLRAGVTLLVAGLVCDPLPAPAQSKPVRLRAETILTPPRAKAVPVLPQSAAGVSGLFLVQLEGPPRAEWSAQLEAAGVTCLKYVPEDAFVARLQNASPNVINSLAFVRWAAPFGPEHKVHPRLDQAAQAAAQADRDLAVNVMLSRLATPAQRAEARGFFVAIAHESALRQGTFLRGVSPPGRLNQLARLDSVLWIERAPKRQLVDELASKIVGGDDGLVATPTVTQQLGFDGTGVTVCVADTGLDTGDTNTMHPDLFGRVTEFHSYGLPDGSDGYGHGTHVAGIVAGDAGTGETDPGSGAWYGLGIASGANLVIERIFDDFAGPVMPFPSDETLTHDAVRSGAQVGCNSWGNDVMGEYDSDAAQFDELVRDADSGTAGEQPYILEFSAGNAGPGAQTIGTPATGKNVLATGASQNVPSIMALTYGLYADGPDVMADFSSRGPCEDGRIKPDVVAPGTWIASLASAAAVDIASVSWTVIDDYYVYMGGTSMSGPYAAAAAAVFVQYYKSLHTNNVPSPALVKAALINSAEPLDELNGGPGPVPNNDEGWGRITLTNIIVTNLAAAPRFYDMVDQAALLTNGQVFARHALVQSPGQPLKITLAYTDEPGFPGAIPALVNDLDLEVVGPDGTLYRGNQFAGSESVPNAPSPDAINNVEGVCLAQPRAGDYLVRVRARRVVQDARLDTAAVDQDFALVISGDTVRPGKGTVLLDRGSYTAPGLIQVEVLDPARAASNTVSVVLKSTTEAAGETYLLHAAGNYGAFTGAVVTAEGPATSDGKLQVHDGDAIEADYVDASGAMRVASAVTGLQAPALTGVAATVDLGVITITWQTSEPATSIVRYGTNFTFTLGVTNQALTTTHTVRLTRLVPGNTYYFYVVSADEAGNVGTNNNGGAYFSFIGIATPTALLVNAYELADGSPEIPDSAYTNALNAAGFTFASWKVLDRGSPKLADLQPFPVVIWRTTDDIINYEGTNNTLTPQQQFMLQTYLSGGGSFFMSSMGILSQVGNVAFRKNVFQVAGFQQNPDPPAPCTECDEDFGVPAIFGAGGNPVTSGMAVTLDYSLYPFFDLDGMVFGPDFSDTFTPGSRAVPIMFEAASGKPCGMCFPRPGTDSPGRVVFLSFPIDTVPDNVAAPNNRATLLRNVLNFLAPGANGVGTITLDSTAYTIPSLVNVEIGDSDLLGAGQTQATFSTSSSTNVVTITLSETTHPGLFRGFLTLVASNAGAGQLAVRQGDTLTGRYFDASAGSNKVTTAIIDTVPPVISQVSATTGYGDAVVRWQTSKPADSLLRYGESLPLSRTVYGAPLVTSHSARAGGLQANKDYYYQVVSRDAAGNTVIDDNYGTNYLFTTRAAPRPPWLDNLETGAPGWTVVPDTAYGTETNWTLGTPANGLKTSAHSGTNAWGSNLQGTTVEFVISTFLFSPEIDLSGFSQVTLTFWHSFDFSSMFEVGQLGISTNNSTPPASIPTLVNYGGQKSLSWQQATVDLTPFVGRTIRIVWYYQGVTIGSPLLGWLVDDIELTGVASGASGTIVVSKNLGQGMFTLNGPVGRTGKAPYTVITNAPPGPYTLHFADVPFYQTPPDQSNYLASASTLTFTGTYGFIDANHNGISDAWERLYFGDAGTNRTGLADSDGDGMSDYGEFIAGTNPTNAASKFVFLDIVPLANHQVKLEWAAIPGRLYQVFSSTNLASWSPASDWLQAVSSPLSLTVTNPAVGSRMYRVQVRP